MKMQKTSNKVDLHPDVASTVRINTDFALDLYRHLAMGEGNLFFSPYSLSTALAMTYGGARGDTETQMARVLHLEQFDGKQARLHRAFTYLQTEVKKVQAEGDIHLDIANALWPQAGYDFLETYLSLVREYYGVSITPLDYADEETARATINAWCEAETQGKIKDLISPGILDALTRLVLTNAIYFKGSWGYQFDEAHTEEAPFWVTPEHSVDGPMMAQTQTLGYASVPVGLQILELPYVDDHLSMLILLPDAVDGLAKLEATLTTESLNDWLNRLIRMEIDVYLPRFTMNGRFKLNAILKSMGMKDAFNNKADFSGMDGTLRLYIAAVLHQAFVDVNEEGTEAAAATAVVMKLKGIPLPAPIFRADHPFIFLIREQRTGTILFIGRVTNPYD